MVERKPGQELARRRLGDALRRYRERANIRLDAAASELECSAAKISRLENGLSPAKQWEVRVLLDLYEVAGRADRVRMERWARESKEPGWWEEDVADLLSPLTVDANLFLAAETEASQLRIWATPVIPAQLQVREYALAHGRVVHPEWSESDLERFAALRARRQEHLLRESDPLRLDAILDEAAVRRGVGGRETHRAQLRWLADTLDAAAAAGRNNLQVRVFPFVAGVPSHAMTSFTIIEPSQPELDRPMILLENTLSASWARAEDVEQLSSVFGELAADALDQESSRRLIREVAEEL